MRDASPTANSARAGRALEADTASWRARAHNAEAFIASLRASIRGRDARISDLTGQLHDPEGNLFIDENAKLRRLLVALNET
ncbi:hypothetical protein IU510_20690 [Nocardia cyriacigeorgica]|uniref:hypothetical protein n=1 Tax=Nocardia cyriacigeorgica TaxID=135487 RepID=UPI001894B5F0|nr:hypothetical protein [Nocardia cyriacigeorgica]MBF6100480.1 hypothetical protein [Nocardia cyriacigeorgica]MBF6320314.1 hypothetical protein [Nocardia cyriacigeorgica]MBF6346310.1 hypothetical protein [Nocardia cyriacigeorgica]MBF6534200.1 hypothetical protein [Nocardia cyriacigeorgica]